MGLNQLVDKVRAANPGAYDDMDDAALTKAVLAKYPQYSDLAAPGLPKPPNAIVTQELRNPRSPNFDSELPGSFEGHPENIGEYLPATVGQMAGGTKDIVQGNVARGAHKIISGGMNAVTPMAPFAVAAAPVAAAVTLASGSAGQYAGQKGAEVLGATPDQAALAGDIGGLAAGYGGAKLSSMSLRAPLGDTVTKPRGPIPPEQYSPAELKAYADQSGIPLNAAQATEHNFPRNVQSAGERASVGGTAVRNQIKASQAAVSSHAEGLQYQMSPTTPDLATAGSEIKQNVAQALEREQLASQQEYATVDDKAQGVTVNLQPLKQTAERILNDSNFVRNIGGLDPRQASAILKGIANSPDSATFTQAQQLRSALLDASRTPELAINNQAQGWIKQLTGAVDSEMVGAAESKPGLKPIFRLANEHWVQLQEDFNNPRSPLNQILQEPDPSKIPQKLVQKGQIGGSPYNAELLDRYNIDKGPVKWAVMNDLMTKDFRLYNKSLGGYGNDFLSSVFTPDELSNIYKTGAIARSVGLNTNPSGTAAVNSAVSDATNPIRSLAPKGIAARLTKSQTFNNFMMGPGAPPAATGPRTVPLSLLLGVRDQEQQ